MRIYVQPNYIQTFVTVACDSLPKQVEGQKKTNTRQLPPPKKKKKLLIAVIQQKLRSLFYVLLNI
jgi:hypothetical protein